MATSAESPVGAAVTVVLRTLGISTTRATPATAVRPSVARATCGIGRVNGSRRAKHSDVLMSRPMYTAPESNEQVDVVEEGLLIFPGYPHYSKKELARYLASKKTASIPFIFPHAGVCFKYSTSQAGNLSPEIS